MPITRSYNKNTGTNYAYDTTYGVKLLGLLC